MGCTVGGCGRDVEARGLCHAHLQRLLRIGDVQADVPIRRRQKQTCSVGGCARSVYATGICRTHYNRRLRSGDVQADVPIRLSPGDGWVSHGYRCMPVPPELRHLVGHDRPAEAEHRLVMATILGRPLRDDESVHHRNGDRLDNRPENLELWSRWQPAGQRIEDKVEWALDVLRLHAPEHLRE